MSRTKQKALKNSGSRKRKRALSPSASGSETSHVLEKRASESYNEPEQVSIKTEIQTAPIPEPIAVLVSTDTEVPEATESHRKRIKRDESNVMPAAELRTSASSELRTSYDITKSMLQADPTGETVSFEMLGDYIKETHNMVLRRLKACEEENRILKEANRALEEKVKALTEKQNATM